MSFRHTLLALALASAIITIAYIDHRLPQAVSRDMLYLIPLGCAAWWLDRSAAWWLVIHSGFARCLVAFERGTLTQPTPGLGGALLFGWNILTFAAQFAIFTWLILAVRDALARERSAARLDPLTGLLNRRAFTGDLRDAVGDPLAAPSTWRSRIVRRATRMARRRAGSAPTGLAIAYIDLDGFKAVNDSLGHEIGDMLLQEAASVFRGAIRAGDKVARLGGDEFAILLPGADVESARSVAARLMADLGSVAATRGWAVSASVGIAAFETPPGSADNALRAADALMYDAKRSGRGQVRAAQIPRAGLSAQIA